MDHKDLLRRRFDFYKEIKKKVEIYLGKSPSSIERYKKTYLSEIRKLKPRHIVSPKRGDLKRGGVKTTDIKRDLFFKSLKQTQLLLFGDFHSEPQSMRSLLRVCRKLKSSQVVLGLECIHFKHQALLEKYLAGHISETDFLDQTLWAKNWNFSFEFIKPLLHWASQNKVSVYGINKSDANLSVRDQKIAANIKVILGLHPNQLLIVQIGDYHLAQKHLPKQIYKVLPKVKMQTVFQSPDDVYFQLMSLKKNVPDFIQFNKNQWAVMAVLPWVKWQNYLLWLETSASYKLDDEIDMTDHIARFVKFISETLKIPTETSEVSIYALTDVNTTLEFKNLEAQVRFKIKKDIEDQKSFFVPELQKGYLESFSLNHISKLAAEYFLYKQQVYLKTILDPQKNFLSLIWIEMLTYFFTKIVNPKRKADTVFDMRSFLMSEQFEDHGKDVLAIALEQKLKEMNSTSAESRLEGRSQSILKNKKSYASAARLLGGIMGEKIFWAYSHQRLVFPEGKTFLFQDIYNKSFQVRYYDLIEVIDHWPTTVKSKFDQF